MTQQWDLMRELATMQDRMNRIWGNVYDRGREDVSGAGAWLPAVDIYETGEKEKERQKSRHTGSIRKHEITTMVALKGKGVRRQKSESRRLV